MLDGWYFGKLKKGVGLGGGAALCKKKPGDFFSFAFWSCHTSLLPVVWGSVMQF